MHCTPFTSLPSPSQQQPQTKILAQFSLIGSAFLQLTVRPTVDFVRIPAGLPRLLSPVQRFYRDYRGIPAVAPPDRRLDRRPTAFTTMRYTN